MTTADPQYPAEAPEFTTLIRGNLSRSGVAFCSLGSGIFDFLEAAGTDVRIAVKECIEYRMKQSGGYAALPAGTLDAILVQDPRAAGERVASHPRSMAIWTMTGVAAGMDLSQDDLPLLSAIIDYYNALPEDRKTFDSVGGGFVAPPSADPASDSFAAMMTASGMEVPPPVKPADDTVTGEDVPPVPRETAAEMKSRIAQKHGVDPRDVIIFGEEDEPDVSN